MSGKKKFSFKGWSLTEFLKGRKRLLVTFIGAVATFLTTENPMLTGIVAAASELLFALIEFYLKDD